MSSLRDKGVCPVTGVIIQARLGSTRLPNKVLMKLPNSKTVIETVVQAARESEVGGVYLTTPDPELVGFCGTLFDGCHVHIGCRDVVREYFDTAKEFRLSTIVRITADAAALICESVSSFMNKYIATTPSELKKTLVKVHANSLDAAPVSRLCSP